MNKITPIGEVQGSGLWSDMAGQKVTVQAVVTAVIRRGFFIQSVRSSHDPLVSDAIFVFSPGWEATTGALVNVSGKVVDFVKQDNGKPVTQIKLESAKLIKRRGPVIEPFELTADNLPDDPDEQAIFLNGLEGMLASIAVGQTFIAPSNLYGDYVLILDADKAVPGVIRSVELIRDELISLRQQGLDYYVTGDFNDSEKSEPLAALVGDESVNLVDSLLPEQRYDYNHRGKLQVLMHGIVSRAMAQKRAEYDIIHGNELSGVKPGQASGNPSDHAYVIARLKMH